MQVEALLPLRGRLANSLAFAIALAVAGNVSAENQIHLALAGHYFGEASALCERDAGSLWGVSLCGPMLFADPKDRAVVANQQLADGGLSVIEKAFTGTLPSTINVANSAVDWGGAKWTMLMWPLPKDARQRAILLMHESWHRIQSQIGLPATMPANNHLDRLEGRLWVQLEWRALRAALAAKGAQRRRAIADALLFRGHRRSLFPQAEADERALEMNEGLAEYTGVKLASGSDAAAEAIRKLGDGGRVESLVRSFAYTSGPAYGVLLDEAGAKWRRDLRPEDDLGALLRGALALPQRAPAQKTAVLEAKRYGYDSLRAAEETPNAQRRERFARYRAALVDGPVLKLPLQRMRIQFNPDEVYPLDQLGTVYPSLRIVDNWGVLTASAGALVAPGFDRVTVSAPLESSLRPLRGEGWTLELNEGWALVPGERRGDYALKRAN